ncbi:hypothetical protein [Leptothoe sp. PORK10 BA2]|uniref:hypothetical protein n=1 Tax=Leptothoe sp. PORK10 BA2 TaxID=3110254 RepID=UPI002B1FCBF4|nr:hypothetical protein [Leptothoe sp. PORK10 BA2]MEA5464221.1 hypothetical protein [Leptothoe sp. PORK10 BA2]
MADLTITNELGGPIEVWDSFADADEHKNYFGTLTKLADVAAGATVKVTALHALSTLIVYDKDQKPVTRWSAGMGHTAFTASQDDVAAMDEANAFIEYVAQHPGSPESKGVVGKNSATDLTDYFRTQPKYDKVTGLIYMTALTWRAAHPAPAATPPQQRRYSLSQLLPVLTGSAYPSGMPDITLTNLFFHDQDGILKLGGVVTLTDMPFEPSLAGVALKLLAAAGPVNVEIDVDTNPGLNMLGTRLRFYYKEIDVGLGGDHKLRIVGPYVTLSINPAFKFVVLQVGAHFPFTVFRQTFDTKLSMVVDNVEIEVGFDLDSSKAQLPPPPGLQGVHFDDIGVGMGVIFEPPGYALGLEGKFHIGEGGSIALDDDTFALILDLEGDVPNPVYLSFYVPKLDLPTVLTALTDQNISIDVPVEFSDLSFRWSENPLEPLALPDGTLAKGGYGFSAQMDLLGLQFYADVDIALDHIKADAVMAPLDLGGVFGLTGKGKPVEMKFDAKGNPIRNNVVPKTAAEREAIKNATKKQVVAGGGPELHVSTAAEPYFQMDATATLFGVVFEQIDAKVDKSGLAFHLKMPLAEVTCKLSEQGKFAGAFSFGPDFKISLPSPLGSIHLQATIDVSLGLEMVGGHLKVSAGAGFSFMGEPLNFGPFTIDVNVQKLEDVTKAVENYILAHAVDLFEKLLADPLAWAKAAFDKDIDEVENIASGLKDYFKHTADQAAKVLKDIGMATKEAAEQLQGAFAGITPAALMAAMSGPFGLTGALAAPLMKELGFTPDNIASALHSAFGLDAKATAKLLGDIGEPVENISRVIGDVFTLSPNTVADVLKTVGYPAQVIADAFKAIGGPFAAVGDAISSALNTVIDKLNPTHW